MALLSAVGEGVAIAGRDGDLHWTNEMLRAQTGALRERVSGACRQFNREHPLPTPSVGRPEDSPRPQMGAVLSDGDRFFEVVVSPIDPRMLADATGEPATWVDGLVVILRDVSAARRLQQKINAIDMAGSELMRFDADAVRKYNAHERLKLLEAKIVRFARELLHFDHFAIRLLDEKSGRLELVIGYDLPPDFDSFVIMPALEGHGISGHVAASGRSYVCEDTAKDDLYLPGVEGAKSSLTVPLRLHDKVIGIMNVESLRSRAFTEEDRQLGEIFARYVAVAIHMLDLLVVERSTTNQTISGRVAGELNEPLEDIVHEVEVLRSQSDSPAVNSHLERIRRDIESIRSRIKECAAGPASLLGVEQALADKTTDPALAGRRVLVADDEPRIRRIIGDVLTNRGSVVTVCKNGLEAMNALKAPDPFDLIISDIRMPDHNGYEIFAAARKSCSKAPVILMTGFGYDPHHSIVRAHQEGLQSVLFKPFQVERLIEEVKKALAAEKK
jgi:CheY-like chemotaxis protein